MKQHILLLFMFVNVVVSLRRQNYVVRTPIGSKKIEKEGPVLVDPVIYEMNIHTNISNRFAKTLVTSKVRNPNLKSQETTFTVILPEKAFISGFVLKIGEKEYKAYVKEKEEAKKIYEVAKARGQTAGHVAVSAADSNTFTIAVNVEPEAKAAFLLTFEELLERKNNQYELTLNIHPGQVVEKLDVKVLINESRPLSFVRTPSVRITGNEINKNDDTLNELSKIEIIEKKTAVVEFHPDKDQQMEFARRFGKKETEGLAGQFVVQYDVQRDPNGGEVLLQDGYFVHFFAPDDLKPLPKHVVFVLDTSGSMGGTRIRQLKDAMNNILDQIPPEDLVSLIEFNSGVYVWNFEAGVKKEAQFENYADPFKSIDETILARPFSIKGNDTLNKAKKVIEKLNAGGSTNVIGGLEVALSLVKKYAHQKNGADQNLQPMIMFLTDGEPMGSSEFNSKQKIHKIITKLNSDNNGVPIFTLSFGDDVDRGFLRKLSLENSGFSRHIFTGGDVIFQLENFYKEISVPLLSNIKFDYADKVNVTKYRQSVFFRGGEIAICGVYDPIEENPLRQTKILGTGNGGYLSLVPSIEKPVSSLERLWAYLTVKHKLDQRETAETDLDKYKITKSALELALKYSFVTDVTSLVVVKPNDTHGPNPFSIPRRLLRPLIRTRTGQFASPVAALEPESEMDSGVMFSSRFQSSAKLGSANQVLGAGGSGGASITALKAKATPVATTYKPHHYTTTVMPITTAAAPTPTPTAWSKTPATTSTITWSSKLKTDLSWLESVILPNNSLNVQEGNFLLGDNTMTNLAEDECPQTPLNGTDTGICTLLKDCPEVFTYLTDFQAYQLYFCPVSDKYAGVCCPKKKGVEN